MFMLSVVVVFDLLAEDWHFSYSNVLFLPTSVLQFGYEITKGNAFLLLQNSCSEFFRTIFA